MTMTMFGHEFFAAERAAAEFEAAAFEAFCPKTLHRISQLNLTKFIKMVPVQNTGTFLLYAALAKMVYATD